MQQVMKLCLMIGMATALAGCGDNERLVQFAAQSNRQQSEQNQAMARVSQEATETTRRAIESENQSREKLLALHQDLQTQRGQIETERQKMSTERSELHAEEVRIAEEQRWDSQLGPILLSIGTLLVCSLPLVLCWKLLSGLSSDPQEEQISAVLIEQLVAEPGRLLLEGPVHDALPPPESSQPDSPLPRLPDRH